MCTCVCPGGGEAKTGDFISTEQVLGVSPSAEGLGRHHGAPWVASCSG